MGEIKEAGNQLQFETTIAAMQIERLRAGSGVQKSLIERGTERLHGWWLGAWENFARFAVLYTRWGWQWAGEPVGLHRGVLALFEKLLESLGAGGQMQRLETSGRRQHNGSGPGTERLRQQQDREQQREQQSSTGSSPAFPMKGGG